jgi:hypothetical protein
MPESETLRLNINKQWTASEFSSLMHHFQIIYLGAVFSEINIDKPWFPSRARQGLRQRHTDSRFIVGATSMLIGLELEDNVRQAKLARSSRWKSGAGKG